MIMPANSHALCARLALVDPSKTSISNHLTDTYICTNFKKNINLIQLEKIIFHAANSPDFEWERLGVLTNSKHRKLFS